MASSLMSNRSPRTAPSPLWIGHQIVLGLSCGVVGYYLAQEDDTKRRFSQALQKVKKFCLKKNLWEAAVPWWLVLACPSPWYPLALWFVVSTQQDSDDKDEDGDAKNVHDSDPFVANAHPTTRLRSAETRSDSLSLTSVQNEIPPEKPKRYLEMLVHNVSHTDLVLSVDAPPDSKEDVYCLCRPRFSAFDLYCRRILENLSGQEEIVSFPRYERSEASPRYTIVSPKPSRQGRLSTGLALEESVSLNITTQELPNLRFRGRDAHRIEPYYAKDKAAPPPTDSLKLSHVFFPLLATLLPRWQKELTKKYASRDVSVKKVVVLVSGVGTPRNWTHSITGNSTQTCAGLMKKFIQSLYPEVTVVCIHSNTNIFRYDENIVFVKRELMPVIDAYRDAHARGLPYPDETSATLTTTNGRHPFSPDWKQSFSVTLSFADGSHARTHAIQTSLRPYRPTYFHLWQLKSFWHDTKIVEDDLEVHSFEDMETVPAVDVNLVVEKNVKLVVEEMNRFRNDFLASLEHDNDVATFWLRKTRKPVLAVLLVAGENGTPIMYRGTNMEVSMPTGSLCAERNVIGTALASNPALKREDLKMVAVLAVPIHHMQQQTQETTTTRPSDMPRSSSLASYSSIQVEDDGDEEVDWVMPAEGGGLPVEKIAAQEVVPVYHVSEPSSEDFTPRSTPPGTPVRRITLYSQAQEASSSQLDANDDKSKPTMGLGRLSKLKKTVLVHSAEVCSSFALLLN